VAPVLSVLIIVIAVAASFVVAIVGQGVVAGSYWQSFGAYASMTDLTICILKSIAFGFVVVIIAARRGLDASGGARGVADAVNASVVLGIVAAMVINLIITQIVALFIPVQVI
jgi:phospholipid/cholesterol/gamma-HCH transport system permease protein